MAEDGTQLDLVELEGTYEVLRILVTRAIGNRTGVDYHVLSAATDIVHRALLHHRKVLHAEARNARA